jgi:hypothetical protein
MTGSLKSVMEHSLWIRLFTSQMPYVNHNIKTEKYFGSVGTSKYLGTTQRNQNSIHAEINNKLNSEISDSIWSEIFISAHFRHQRVGYCIFWTSSVCPINAWLFPGCGKEICCYCSTTSWQHQAVSLRISTSDHVTRIFMKTHEGRSLRTACVRTVAIGQQLGVLYWKNIVPFWLNLWFDWWDFPANLDVGHCAHWEPA